MHVCSMAFQDTNTIVPKSHGLLQDRIYQVYNMHIPCESHVQAFLVAHQHLEASDQYFLRMFSVLATEAAHARLGPSKVPQPGVDLVNMAVPPQVMASTIGTAALKSVLLSAAVLVWNS